MSTNIKLLIALLLGAAIGALVMNKTNTITGANTCVGIIDTTQLSFAPISQHTITNPLSYDKALGMVRRTEVDDLIRSKVLYTKDKDEDTTSAVKSWVMDKNEVLRLLGIKFYIDSDKDVTGMRCYLGFNDDERFGYTGYTLVCLPTDSKLDVIKRDNPTSDEKKFPEAIEYHLPCPKHCGTPNHPNDLSRPQ